MLEQVAELNEGGGALLKEAQERHNELSKQLHDEKLKHDQARETLKQSQKLLDKAEREMKQKEEMMGQLKDMGNKALGARPTAL